MKQKGDKEKELGKNPRQTLWPLAFIFIMAGSVLLLRSFFMQTTFDSNVDNSTLKFYENEPLSILGVGTDIGPAEEFFWSEGVTSSLTPTLSAPKLLVKTASFTNLADIVSKEVHFSAISLPGTIENIRIYNKDTYTYSIPATNVAGIKLFGVHSDASYQLLEIERGWSFGGAIFSQHDQAFFYLSYNNDGEVKIYKYYYQRTPIVVFTTSNFLMTNLVSITRSGNDTLLFFDGGENGCFELNLTSKISEPKQCSLIQTRQDSKNFAVNYFDQASYVPGDVGNIFVSDTEQGSIDIAIAGGVGDYFLLPVHKSGILAYLKYKVVEYETGKYTLEQDRVGKYDLEHRTNIESIDISDIEGTVKGVGIGDSGQILTIINSGNTDSLFIEEEGELSKVEVPGCELSCELKFIY